MREGDLPLPEQADVYFQWAAASGFEYLSVEDGWIGAIAKFETPLQLTPARIAQSAAVSMQIPYFYDGRPIVGLLLQVARLAEQLAILIEWGLQRIELAAAVRPIDLLLRDFEFERSEVESGKDLLGIIDHGCPFAHQHYILPSGATRVVLVWNQNRNATVGAPFYYGTVLYHSHLTTLITAAIDPSGRVDENAAYEASGLPGLRGAASHGAMVMSQAAGPLPLRARLSPSRFVGGDATDPPPRTQAPSSTDIVFVQLPKEAIDDSSGLWLSKFGLDGLVAIYTYAVLCGYNRNVVANLSYGPQTGPHDGTSLMEEAIALLTAPPPPGSGLPRFFVTLPAGNAHIARAHVEIDIHRAGGVLDWYLAPASQVPTFMEVWLPVGVNASNVVITVTGPDGNAVTAVLGSIIPNAAGTLAVVMMQGLSSSHRVVALIVVAPTARPSRATAPVFPLAPPGCWKVSVTPRVTGALPNPCVAHAWLARNDYNIGGAQLGRAGYLRTANDDPDRYNRKVDDQINSPPLPPTRTIGVVARGNMNGIGTGQGSQLAGGYCLGDYKAGRPKRPAGYTGGGPTSGTMRAAPDWVYPTEESRVLSGVPCGANRSVCVMRLDGTSTAAPQYARDLLAGGAAALGPAPTPITQWVQRIGQGYKG